MAKKKSDVLVALALALALVLLYDALMLSLAGTKIGSHAQLELLFAKFLASELQHATRAKDKYEPYAHERRGCGENRICRGGAQHLVELHPADQERHDASDACDAIGAIFDVLDVLLRSDRVD